MPKRLGRKRSDTKRSRKLFARLARFLSTGNNNNNTLGQYTDYMKAVDLEHDPAVRSVVDDVTSELAARLADSVNALAQQPLKGLL